MSPQTHRHSHVLSPQSGTYSIQHSLCDVLSPPKHYLSLEDDMKGDTPCASRVGELWHGPVSQYKVGRTIQLGKDLFSGNSNLLTDLVIHCILKYSQTWKPGLPDRRQQNCSGWALKRVAVTAAELLLRVMAELTALCQGGNFSAWNNKWWKENSTTPDMSGYLA